MFPMQQYMHTTAISNNIDIDNQAAQAPLIYGNFLPTNVNVQAGRNSVFCSERCNYMSLSNFFMQ